MERDVSGQFQEFVGIAGEYSQEADMVRQVVGELSEASATFQTSVQSIEEQMDMVKNASNENEIGIDEIIAKNERTSAAAETLSDVLQTNQDNTTVLQTIIERFETQ